MISAGENVSNPPANPPKEQPLVLTPLLSTVAMELSHLSLCHMLLSERLIWAPHIGLLCFCPKTRHSHAQFLLRWLQARPVRQAFVWSGDKVGVLLRQHRVCLRRTLPAVPAAKFWYGSLNKTHTHTCDVNETHLSRLDELTRQLEESRNRESHCYGDSHMYPNTPTHTSYSRSSLVLFFFFHVHRLTRRF